MNDTNDARPKRMREELNGGRDPLEEKAKARAELRLPDMDADEPSIQPRAYLHRTADTCVTVDPTAYENPRVLVAWDDVADAVDWLEKGIAEWRAYAIEAGKQLAKLRAHQKDQMDALIAAEAFVYRVQQWKEGQPDKHDTLVMLRDTIAKGS